MIYLQKGSPWREGHTDLIYDACYNKIHFNYEGKRHTRKIKYMTKNLKIVFSFKGELHYINRF